MPASLANPRDSYLRDRPCVRSNEENDDRHIRRLDLLLRLASEGRSGPDIAEELHLTEGTVRNYLSEAISQIGGRNRVDAARIARTKGWL
jgi:two-component system response regulator DesR